MWWPYWLRPILSARADARVQGNTFTRYAAVLLVFLLAVNSTIDHFYRHDYSVLNEQLIGFLAGQHCLGLKNHDVRAFSSAIRFFIPYCPKDRISAELKGVEKSTPTTPTTPRHVAAADSRRPAVGDAAGRAPRRRSQVHAQERASLVDSERTARASWSGAYT